MSDKKELSRMSVTFVAWLDPEFQILPHFDEPVFLLLNNAVSARFRD